MSLISLPFPLFVNGAASDGSQVTSDFSTLVNAINGNLDNTNIGAAGIFASQIKAGSALQATFTTATIGFTFLAGATSIVPLTIAGVTSQTADIFDIMLTAGGTKAFGISNVGAMTTQVGVFDLNGATAQVITASAATGGWSFTNAANNATNVSWTDAGALTVRAGIAATTGSFTGQFVNQIGNFNLNGAVAQVITASAATGGWAFTNAANNATNISWTDVGNAIVRGTLATGGAITASTTYPISLGYPGAGTNIVYLGNDTLNGMIFNVMSTAAIGWSFKTNNVAEATISPSGVYTAISDVTLKQNVVSLGGSSLAVVAKLRPVSFQWIRDQSASVGFIAQEVQLAIPQAVSVVDQNSGLLGISDAAITPYVVAAIQQMVALLKAAGVAGFAGF